MMKVISLLLLALCLLSLRCSTKQKQFRDFDPLKKALADNKVLAYISYAMDKGKLLKGDTIVVDSKGNEIIRDGFGFMTPTVTKKFDRLDRPVSVFWKSDISWFEKFEYESPSQYVLIRNEFVGGYPTDTCRLLSRTITEFDPETGLPLKQEQIGNLNNSNTEKYEFNTMRIE